MVDIVSLDELSDIPIVETPNGQVTADSLLDVARGRPITNLTVDLIGDLIMDSGVRCYVMDSVTATELYTKGIWPEETPVWPDYDALLLPIHEAGHWLLAVADLTSSNVFFLDPDEDPSWCPNSSIRDWLRVKQGGQWCQDIWPAPQQQQGSADCAVAVMTFMIRIARGDGLPIRGSPHGACTRVLPSYTPGALSHMRGRIFATLLYTNLDPPTALRDIASGLLTLRVSLGFALPQHMVSRPAAVGTRWWCDPTAYGLRSATSPEAGVQPVKRPSKTRPARSISRQRCRLRRMRQRVRRMRTRRWQVLLNAELYSDGQHQAHEQPTDITSDTDKELDDAPRRERAATDVLAPTVMPLPQQPNVETHEDLVPVEKRLLEAPHLSSHQPQASTVLKVPTCSPLFEPTLGASIVCREEPRKQANLDGTELALLFPHETESAPPENPALAADTSDSSHCFVPPPQVCTTLSEPTCPPLSAPSDDDPRGHAELLKLLSLRQKGPYRPMRCLLPFLRQPCVSRHCHRPSFVAMPISSSARVPTRAVECPSLGETGPVLPVRAFPQVRAGVG